MPGHPHKRRPLSFEPLEGKTSPTASLLGPAWAPPATNRSAADFLTYAATMLQESHLERANPSPLAAQQADACLETEQPPGAQPPGADAGPQSR